MRYPGTSTRGAIRASAASPSGALDSDASTSTTTSVASVTLAVCVAGFVAGFVAVFSRPS